MMADLNEVLAQARALSPEDRETLARELAGSRPTLAQLGTLAERPPSPHSVAWLKSERGHAVLATDTGPADADIPAGADAIAGMWGARP
jgi:hypothetical protein